MDAMNDNSQEERLTVEKVSDGAISTLGSFPTIARYINGPRIESSVTLTWPAPAAPIIYWLWVAGNDDFPGAAPARNLLSSLEMILKLLENAPVFSGSWRSRAGKLFPPGSSAVGKDHLTEFRSALFELLLAFRLFGKDVVINFLPDTAVACDLEVSSGGTGPVAVEAYAPQKAVDSWFEQGVATPWRSLIVGDEVQEDPEQELGEDPGKAREIFLDPDDVPRALSNVLTDSNFQKQKAKQLSSGDLPTLLAIRAYELIPRLENLLTIESADALVRSISGEAWSKLPQKCLGLLLCFISDVLGEAGYVMFLPAPGKNISPDVRRYLNDIGIVVPGSVEPS
jgi:hypothetical protein